MLDQTNPTVHRPAEGCDCVTCKKIQLAIRRANDARKLPCSLCKAQPGQSCVKPSGTRRPPHAERYHLLAA